MGDLGAMDSSMVIAIQASAHCELEEWLCGLGILGCSTVVHELLSLGAATPHDVLLLGKQEIEGLQSVQKLPLILMRKLIKTLEQMRQDGQYCAVLASPLSAMTTAAEPQPPRHYAKTPFADNECGLEGTWEAIFNKGEPAPDQHSFEMSGLPLCDVLDGLGMGRHLALLEEHRFDVRDCAAVDADILRRFGIPVVDCARLVSTARELLGLTSNRGSEYGNFGPRGGTRLPTGIRSDRREPRDRGGSHQASRAVNENVCSTNEPESWTTVGKRPKRADGARRGAMPSPSQKLWCEPLPGSVLHESHSVTGSWGGFCCCQK